MAAAVAAYALVLRTGSSRRQFAAKSLSSSEATTFWPVGEAPGEYRSRAIMRDLLLLSYTFPPDNMAAAVRPGQLREYLPAFGYRPHVVASSFEGATNADPFVR